MNDLRKHQKLLPALLALAPTLLWTGQAHASAGFNSSATLTYTVTSISNLTTSGSLSGLGITGSFALAPPPDYLLSLTGDGSVSNNNPDIGPIAVGSSFSHTFAISGTASYGSVDSSHLGSFSLNLDNGSSDSYAIGLKLDYQLNAATSGQHGNSSIALDYSAGLDETFFGSDYIAASTFTTGNATVTGTGLFNFTLGAFGSPSASEALYADVRITGNLESSGPETSPVPLPASVWLLFTGLTGIASLARPGRTQA